LEQLDPQVKQRVPTAIGRLVSDPRSADLRKLKGRPDARRSVWGLGAGGSGLGSVTHELQ
jgi:hypothetical protein